MLSRTLAPTARRGGLAAALLAAAVLLSACGADDSTAQPAATTQATTPADADEATSAAEPHNEADVMFAQSMIPHHVQAMEMSDVVLAKDGVDPKVTELAEKIKAAQGPEIDTMQSWLQAWGEDAPDTSEGMGHSAHGGAMAGMMSPEDMKALEDASGPAATRLFLEQMTKHHEGAIAMARTEVTGGQNPAAMALAQQIIDDQQAEIAQMRQLLRS